MLLQFLFLLVSWQTVTVLILRLLILCIIAVWRLWPVVDMLAVAHGRVELLGPLDELRLRLIQPASVVARRDLFEVPLSLVQRGIPLAEGFVGSRVEGVGRVQKVTLLLVDFPDDVLFRRIQLKQLVCLLGFYWRFFDEELHLGFVKVAVQHFLVAPNEVNVGRVLWFSVIEQVHGPLH